MDTIASVKKRCAKIPEAAPEKQARKKYSFKDQFRFAELSGDHNPLHLKPFEARRELFGDVVVHGLRVLLDGMDMCVSSIRPRGRVWFAQLRCIFQNPVYLNTPVCFTCVKTTPDRYHVEARGRNGLLLVDLFLSVTHRLPPFLPHLSLTKDSPDENPAMLSLEDLRNRSGVMPLTYDRRLALRLFPHLAKAASPVQMAGLLCVTRLVGMECPGMRSILSSLELRFEASSQALPGLQYKVSSVNERFRKADMQLTGPCLEGTVRTFVRPGPQQQHSYAKVRELIDGRAFADHTALIIGGTRGLGEITAKIIAAGGGYPVITYHSGAPDAERIKNEIVSGGGRCAALPFDVTDPGKHHPELEAFDGQFSAVYYFATPKIFVKKGSAFDAELLSSFNRYYVTGLNDTYALVRKRCRRTLVFFNPSSTAIDEKLPELMEYALSKKASEDLCGRLATQDMRLRTVIKRLPRTATDQTLTLTGVPAASAVELMLPIVKEVYGLQDAR